MELLEQITGLWLKQIDNAVEHRERVYARGARQVARYCGRCYDAGVIPEADDTDFPMARRIEAAFGFLPKRSLAQEFVDVTLPYIYSRVPNRLYSPLAPPVPAELRAILPQAAVMQDAIRQRYAVMAYLLGWVGNWLPRVNNLKAEGLSAAEEALVWGRGLLWHEHTDGPFGDVPGSFFVPARNHLIDPDCEQFRDAGYLVRRCRRSNYRIADMFDLDRDKLRGMASSSTAAARHRSMWGDDDRLGGETERDVGEYFEIYSRMGMGHKLVGVPREWREMATAFDEFGPYVYLAVMNGVPHPLNLDPDKLGPQPSQEAVRRFKANVAWPIKTFGNFDDPWPCSRLEFRSDTRTPWARPPLEPAMPLLRFVDTAYTFAMIAVKNAVRQITVSRKGLPQDIKDAIQFGLHDEIVELDGQIGEDMDRLIKVLEHKAVGGDLWRVISLAENAFRLSAGMLPEQYGATPEAQDRSATATNVRDQRLASRPNFYADCVETFMTAAANKEMILMRQMDPASLAGLFSDGTQLDDMGQVAAPGEWMKYWLEVCHTADPAVAAGDVAVSVEAGTGRPKNQQKKIADAQQLMQTFGPFAMQVSGQTGDVAPLRVMLEVIGEAIEDDLGPLADAFEQALGAARQQAAAAAGPPAAEGAG